MKSSLSVILNTSTAPRTQEEGLWEEMGATVPPITALSQMQCASYL